MGRILLLAAALSAAPLSAQIQGCYDAAFGPWSPLEPRVPSSEPPPPSDLDGEAEQGLYIFSFPPRLELKNAGVVFIPPDALPTPHFSRGWSEEDGTLEIIFLNGFSGTRSRLEPREDGWSGTIHTVVDYEPAQRYERSITLHRVACDSPPPVPASADPPLPGEVQLTDLPSLRLGRRLGDLPASSRGARLGFDGESVSGLWAGADSVLVRVGRSELVTEIELRYPREFDVRSLVERIAELYGPPSHPLSPETPIWRNRTTKLVVRLWSDLPFWVVTLEDMRHR